MAKTTNHARLLLLALSCLMLHASQRWWDEKAKEWISQDQLDARHGRILHPDVCRNGGQKEEKVEEYRAFSNPREHRTTNPSSQQIHVNDLVKVKYDDKAPSAILSYQDLATPGPQAPAQPSAAPRSSLQIIGESVCPKWSLFGGGARDLVAAPPTFAPPQRPVGPKWWVGIVRKANHSATGSDLEIHHLDGWLRDDLSNMMIVPTSLHDPTAPGGMYRERIPDVQGNNVMHQMYDQRVMKGGYWFEETSASNDHYVRIISTKSQECPSSVADDFSADLEEHQPEVTKLIHSETEREMHSDAMDLIDINIHRQRQYWKAMANYFENKDAGCSVAFAAGSFIEGNGFYSEVLKQPIMYSSDLGHTFGFNDDILTLLEGRSGSDSAAGTLLAEVAACRQQLNGSSTVQYTLFDRAEFLKKFVAEEQNFDVLVKAELAPASKKENMRKMLEANRIAREKANAAKADSDTAPKRRMTREDIRKMREEQIARIAMDKAATEESQKQKIAYDTAVDAINAQRHTGLIVTGKKDEWGITTDELPAENSTFWTTWNSAKSSQPKTAALAMARVKDTPGLRLCEEVKLVMVKQLATPGSRKVGFAENIANGNKYPYRAVCMAVKDDIPRPSDEKYDENPLGPIQTAKFHLHDLLKEKPNVGSSSTTPTLFTHINGQDVTLSGWEEILAFGTTPIGKLIDYTRRISARPTASITAIRR